MSLAALAAVVVAWGLIGDTPFIDLESERGTAGGPTTAPEFSVSQLRGEISDNPTSLQFGPDGRLYVAQENGLINIYTVSRHERDDYRVDVVETIELIVEMPNHDDDGSLNPEVEGRLIGGILVTGDRSSPVVYVTSSDPRVGAGGGDGLGIDTNSGVISRLNWDGSSWTRLDLVRGLPRSRHNHATNGLAKAEDRNILYVAQGGNTNMGAPSRNFAELPEYALSSAILAVDLEAIGETTYDLPTLDDADRPNRGAEDEGDPFGGNSGNNQAMLIENGPVQIYSPGWRNVYDLVLTSDGRMYAVDNSPEVGWGDEPDQEGSAGNCTNEPVEPGVTLNEGLHFIDGQGYYAGHPNPTRGNAENTFGGQSPVAVADLRECDYIRHGNDLPVVAALAASTNGITEYLATNFGGGLRGHLIVASFDGQLLSFGLSEDGASVDLRRILASGFADLPLDVTAQENNDDLPGTIWVASYGDGSISVLEPKDYEELVEFHEGGHGGGGGDEPDNLPAQGECFPGSAGDGGQWKIMASAAVGRQEHSFAQAGGQLYMAAGAGALDLQEVYDPDSDSWSNLDLPFPAPIHHVQSVTLDGAIYYIGGLFQWPYADVSSVHIYEPQTGDFERGTDMPFDRSRGAGGIAVHEGKIYYAGGIHDGTVVPWFDVYDPETGRWEELPDMPAARDHFHGEFVDGVFYAIGGRDLEVNDPLLADYSFDLSATPEEWEPLPDSLPTPRAGYASAVVGDEILIIGGETEETDWNNVEAYNTVTREWRALAPLPTPRHGVAATIHDGVVYVSGGAQYQQDSPTLVTSQLEALFIDGAPECS